MKQGTLATKLIMLVLFLGVVGYLGVYVVTGLSRSYDTAAAYRYTVEDKTEAGGYLVRAEVVLQGQGDLAQVLVQEGEKVALGQTIARVYRDAAALERQQELDALDDRIAQIETVMSTDKNSVDAMELDQSITDAITALRASVAKGDFSSLPQESAGLKSLIFRRAYTYNGEVSLTDVMAQLKSQRDQLSAQAAGDSTAVTAPAAGVYSAGADGFEYILTPESLWDMTPGDYLQLESGRTPIPQGSAMGKLVTDSTWYLAALVDESAAAGMKGTVTVRFSTDYSGTVDMTVERVSPAENGKAVVVLSANRYLAQTAMLRYQTVDLVYDSITGIRVPKRAVRMEDGPAGEDGAPGEPVLGVYIVTGLQAEWKPVDILWEDENFYLVRPVDESASNALHPGDEVITSGTDLADGKVIKSE